MITGESPEFLHDRVLPIVKTFLAERGLQLSEEKTVITHIDDGFDFLGKNIRKYNGNLLIKPAKTSIQSFLGKVRDIIKSNKSTKQDTLIRKLNPVIRGWVLPARCWSSTILNSTTGATPDRPSSSLYSGSTISYSFLKSTALSTFRSMCSRGTSLSVSTSSTMPRSIFPFSTIFLTLLCFAFYSKKSAPSQTFSTG
ncbi:MAG: hypothetical protein HFF17_01065 [Oscillospiraceae bacterium]|nr:hypothetical protein [Oscillospiraceae bacterium]